VASSAINGSGNITLDPISDGSIALTLANGGNLTNNRNYVMGSIRNTTTAGLGDIWAVNSTGPVSPFRGVSLSNSDDTTRGPGTVIRSFTGGAVAGAGTRGRLIFERARGTSASPTAVQSGDTIGSIDATGYTSTGWINDNIAAAVTATMQYTAAENWVSNTNLGSTFQLVQAPTATTITSAANLVPTLTVNPQTFASRSDAFTWANGKTGTTQTMALDVSGNLTVTGDIRVNGNDIQNSGGTSAITLTSANATTTVRGDTFKVNNAADTNLLQLSTIGGKVTLGLTQSRATAASTFATVQLNTYRSADGINYTPSQSGDDLGQFKFNGNAFTSTTPGPAAGPGAAITCYATENWTTLANGTKFTMNTIKTGTLTDFALFDGSSDLIELKSTQTRILDVNGNIVVSVNATNTAFSQPVKFPAYTRTAAAAITGAVGWQIAISDSSGSGGGRPNGLMAYWDTTNSRWSYIHDNSAL
jgi:hypothetical protein